MATWNPQYTAPENVNGGNDFNGQNGVNATDMNACFNNAFYAAQQASNAVTTASNAASTASGAVTTANAALSKANEAIEKAEDAVVGVATTTELGGIKIGYSENGRNYPVELDSDNKAFVNVPWTDTDTNTTYSAGTGLSLSGTTFSIANMITGNVDWANSSINSLPTLFHLEYSGGDCNVAFSSTSGVANVVTDGHFYGDEGQRRCMYTDELPSPGDGLYIFDNQLRLQYATQNTMGGIRIYQDGDVLYIYNTVG